MLIVPVLDLKNAKVVHARHGKRREYRPLSSPLSETAVAGDVLNGYLSLHPFSAIYIADLNAITNTGDNLRVIETLAKKHTAIEFWLDDGLQAARRGNTHPSGIVPVAGTESLENYAEWLTIRARTQGKVILSLDYTANGFVGDADILEHPETWPRRIIVMTLARVGSDAGPQLELLTSLREQAPRCEIFAAGGVRNRDDIKQLEDAGVKGALVASALHSGKLTRESLVGLDPKPRATSLPADDGQDEGSSNHPSPRPAPEGRGTKYWN